VPEGGLLQAGVELLDVAFPVREFWASVIYGTLLIIATAMSGVAIRFSFFMVSSK
jgi:hypothetical protein